MRNCQIDFIVAQLTQPMILIMKLLKKNAKERNEVNVGFSEIKDVTEELCRELL